MSYFRYFNVLFFALVVSAATFSQAQAASPTVKSIQGNGYIYRKNKTERIPMKAGVELSDKDQILLEDNAKGKINCPKKNGNSTTETIPVGEKVGIQTICVEWISPDIRPGADYSVVVGGIDKSIPYLISPRHTLLINKQPIIHWNAVEGVKQYTVKIVTGRKEIWSTRTTQSSIQYAGPTLESGISYEVIIQADNGSSSRDDRSPLTLKLSENLDFRVLRKEDINLNQKNQLTDIDSVLNEAKAYRDYRIPGSLKSIYGLTDSNYLDYGLIAESSLILENYLASEPKSTLARITLANIYLKSGLTLLAEENYLMVLKNSNIELDREERIEAHVRLGGIYDSYLKNKCKAIFHYEKAVAEHKILKNFDLVNNYQNSANQLKKRLRSNVCKSSN